MTKRCLDEGAIQGYLDGELSPEEAARAEAHVAACDACAHAVREAEAELALFASAFELDASVPVPTERLRERIDAAVSELQYARGREAAESDGGTWSVRRWLASLAESFALTPARAAAFGGLAAVLAFAAVFAVLRPDVRRPDNDMASTHAPSRGAQPDAARTTGEPNTTAPTEGQQHETASAGHATPDGPDGTGVPGGTANLPKDAPSRLNGSSHAKVVSARHARATRRPGVIEVEPAGERLLPGEGKYVQAIASLEQTVKRVSDQVLQPSVRAEFEHNVAVVDQAISASRRNAMRNPKDREAAKFLFSAYQSKVELLSAVVEQAQVATLGR